jgi:hypothetical protein
VEALPKLGLEHVTSPVWKRHMDTFTRHFSTTTLSNANKSKNQNYKCGKYLKDLGMDISYSAHPS